MQTLAARKEPTVVFFVKISPLTLIPANQLKKPWWDLATVDVRTVWSPPWIILLNVSPMSTSLSLSCLLPKSRGNSKREIQTNTAF
jgi:hypothetical protein